MNRYNIHGHLLELGHSWEEADEIVGRLAEEAIDEERDRQVIAEFERLEHAQQLENFDGRD